MIRKKNQKMEQSTKKISLPAALFNLSPMKRSKISENSSVLGNIQSSILSQRNYSNGPVCLNHIKKTGKYFSFNEEDQQYMYYCQKCAILLASQGFRVQRVQKIPQVKVQQQFVKPSREEQLHQFLNKSVIKVNKMKQFVKESQQMLENIDGIFSKNEERIELFFENLLETITRHKNKCLHSAKQQRHDVEKVSLANIEYMKSKIFILEAFTDDISSSMESIVKETTEDDYALVMNHYNQTLDQIEPRQSITNLQEPFLPDVQNLEGIIANLIGKDYRGAHFSFDTNRPTFE